MKQNINKDVEEYKRELKRIFEDEIKNAMKKLEIVGGENVPVITILDINGTIYDIEVSGPISLGAEGVKKDVAEKTQRLLKEKNGVALIMTGEGWITSNKKGAQTISVPSEVNPEAVEVFTASIESMVLNEIRVWTVKRDKHGKRIFPLKPLSEGSEFASRWTGDYFKPHKWPKMVIHS